MTRRRGRLGPVALAGWLFADLLLVLAVVTLADRPDPLAAKPRASASPSASPSPSPSPSKKPQGPRSLDRKRQSFEVKGNNDKSLVSQIRKATAKWDGKEAALVQTFGGGQGGTHYAHHVNSLLNKARSGMFPRKAATDDFLKLGRTPSTAEVWVYFYTT
ncbi:hypothetical protein [Streptomyces odontomachi]|uniref:hypothetical protein n=1 Tax=Streptomyces odontomachi TaxID=2944940 RepID=UPI00210D41EB|nr:hypothetical protein [Streptomyces sp. ODS25]